MTLATWGSLNAQNNNNMAFKMKGFSGFKQTSYAGFRDVSKSVSDAGDITKDPTSEGTLDLAGQTVTMGADGKKVVSQGSQDILKEGKHKADRVANFGNRISNVAKAVEEGGGMEGLKGRAADAKAKRQEAKKNADAEPDVTQGTEEVVPEPKGDDDQGSIKISDENKNKLTEQGSKWVNDIIGNMGTTSA